MVTVCSILSICIIVNVKMAKKGQAVQLQTEINTDEEWEKFIQRDGLLVVDVYSDWCGPCSGMSANLKKLKLELGGDMLQLGIAKCDNIDALQRFRNKSEPTWLLIVEGKMVNFMYGANAPKLMRIITEELKNEQLKRDGQFIRTRVWEITEMSDEERVRYDARQAVERAEKDIEDRKKREELHERRVHECNNILENVNNVGVIIIFPHSKDKYNEVLNELLGEAGLVIGYTDKRRITEDLLEELEYFVEEHNRFSPDTRNEILNPANETHALLIKQSKKAAELECTMDEYVCQLIYGKMMKPPGSPDSPAQLLYEVIEAGPDDDDKRPKELIGIWAPPNGMVLAAALKLFFKKIAKSYLIPEPEPTPEYLAVVFDAIRRNEIWQIMQKHPNEIMRYGFFTSEVPEDATLVAKSMKKYDRTTERTFKEKLIIQLSKKRSECLLEFAQARPLYISPNPKEGKRQCKLLFPEDYDEPPEEGESDDMPMVTPQDVLDYLGDKEGGSEEDEVSEEESEEDEDEEEEDLEEEEEHDVDFASLFSGM